MPLPENDDDLLGLPLPGEAPPLPARTGRQPPPRRPGAAPDRLGPAIENSATHVLSSLYNFGKFPGDVYNGNRASKRDTMQPGDTYTEDDAYNDNVSEDRTRLQTLKTAGWGMGASGMNALMRLIPESIPGVISNANAQEGAPAPTGSLDEILFGRSPDAASTKKTAPTGNLDEMLFGPGEPDKVVKPESFTATMRKDDPAVDYERGAPVGTRYRLFKASNEAEQRLVLKREFGEGNYRKGADGNWQWKTGTNGKWATVYPRGVLETLKTGGAFAGAAAPKVIAPALGAAAGGAVGGPPGAVAGAAGAAGIGYALDEALHKGTTGTFAKTPGETLGEGATDMGLAAGFQGARPAWDASKNALMRSSASMARRFAGVDPEAQRLAQTLPPGVTPPVGSISRKFGFEFDRNMRNQLFGDPMAAGRVGAIDARVGDILGRMGIQGPQLASAMRAIRLGSQEKLNPQEAAAGVTGAVQAQEAALTQQQERALQLGREALNRGFNDKGGNWKRSVGASERGSATVEGRPLGERIFGTGINTNHPPGDYVAAGRQFRQNNDIAYGAATQATGDAEIIQVPGEIMHAIDPLTVPANIRNLVDPQTGDLRPMTFFEAHRLRTWLRDKAGLRSGDQSPMGQTPGDFHRMAGEVDGAMAQAAEEHPAAAVARDLLRDADQQYREGVVRFTNDKLNNIAWKVSQGRTPDPGEIADLILDKTSAATTRQLWDMLSPQTRTAVETADLNNIFRDGSRVGPDGRNMMNPQKLLDELDKRASLVGRPAAGNRDAEPFVHDPRLFAEMRRNALDMMALNGDVDVTALARGSGSSVEIRQHLRDALAAREELVRRAEGDSWGAISSQNPQLMEAGADYITKNEGRMLATIHMFGANSPEWQGIQTYAATKLFQDAMMQKSMAKPGAMGRTVSAKNFEDALSKYTAAQQNLLFDPATLDDIKLLVRQANMLFPEGGAGAGASQMTAHIQDTIFTKSGFLKAAKYRLFGAIADSPALFSLLTGAVRQDPPTARGIMSWIAQGGATTALYGLDHNGKGAPAQRPGGFTDRMRVPKPPLPPSYGGINE